MIVNVGRSDQMHLKLTSSKDHLCPHVRRRFSDREAVSQSFCSLHCSPDHVHTHSIIFEKNHSPRQQLTGHVKFCIFLLLATRQPVPCTDVGKQSAHGICSWNKCQNTLQLSSRGTAECIVGAEFCSTNQRQPHVHLNRCQPST